MSLKKQINYYRKELLYKICPITTSKIRYYKSRKRHLNLKNPQLLSEKLMYINLYMDDSFATDLTDKYKVRDYIKKEGYKDLLVELLGVYNSVEEINFDELPNEFVLKCTHGCGYNIVCKNKENFNIVEAKKKLNRWMHDNYAYFNIEKHYESIKPRIICEKYIGELDSGLPIDYKLFCINGKVVLTQCCTDRLSGLKLAYYDLDWIQLDYSCRDIDKGLNIERPINYEEMKKVATKLSKPFDFIRVDFYEIKGKLYIGELTFTPAACNLSYLNLEAEEKLGNILKINGECMGKS